MFKAALGATKRLYGVANFVAILMDPPWDNTGYELGGYPKMTNSSWMDLIDFN